MFVRYRIHCGCSQRRVGQGPCGPFPPSEPYVTVSRHTAQALAKAAARRPSCRTVSAAFAIVTGSRLTAHGGRRCTSGRGHRHLPSSVMSVAQPPSRTDPAPPPRPPSSDPPGSPSSLATKHQVDVCTLAGRANGPYPPRYRTAFASSTFPPHTTMGWPQGPRRNSSSISHLTCTTSSARPHSRNPQRRQGYACGFVRSGEPNLWHS